MARWPERKALYVFICPSASGQSKLLQWCYSMFNLLLFAFQMLCLHQLGSKNMRDTSIETHLDGFTKARKVLHNDSMVLLSIFTTKATGRTKQPFGNKSHTPDYIYRKQGFWRPGLKPNFQPRPLFITKIGISPSWNTQWIISQIMKKRQLDVSCLDVRSKEPQQDWDILNNGEVGICLLWLPSCGILKAVQEGDEAGSREGHCRHHPYTTESGEKKAVEPLWPIFNFLIRRAMWLSTENTTPLLALKPNNEVKTVLLLKSWNFSRTDFLVLTDLFLCRG